MKNQLIHSYIAILSCNCGYQGRTELKYSKSGMNVDFFDKVKHVNSMMLPRAHFRVNNAPTCSVSSKACQSSGLPLLLIMALSDYADVHISLRCVCADATSVCFSI